MGARLSAILVILGAIASGVHTATASSFQDSFPTPNEFEEVSWITQLHYAVSESLCKTLSRDVFLTIKACFLPAFWSRVDHFFKPQAIIDVDLGKRDIIWNRCGAPSGFKCKEVLPGIPRHRW